MAKFVRGLAAAMWLVSLGACGPASGASPEGGVEAVTAATIPTLETASPAAAIPFGESALVARLNPNTQTMELTAVDPNTGEILADRAPIEVGADFSYTYAPEQHALVVTSFAGANADRGELHFIDLAAWKDNFAIILLSAQRSSGLAISPDGARLAISTARARGGSLWLVDMRAHVVLAHLDTTTLATAIRFTSDGLGLMSYEHPNPTAGQPYQDAPIVTLRSATDLSVQWTRTLTGVTDGFVAGAAYTGNPNLPGTGHVFQPAVVFTLKSDDLYVVHANADELTRVDFDRRSVLTQQIHPIVASTQRPTAPSAADASAGAQSGTQLEARIAPDETTIYVAGVQNILSQQESNVWLESQTPLAVRAIRLKDAAVVYGSSIAGASLDLSQDGSTLLVREIAAEAGAFTGTSRVDAATGEFSRSFPGLSLRFDQLIDGTPILVSSVQPSANDPGTTMTVLSADGQPLGSWIAPTYAEWVSLR